MGFIQRRLSSSQGVAEWIGFLWRNQSEWGGDLNRNQVALSNGIGWRLAPEYAPVMKKWNSGQTVYFANSILKKIEFPDTKPFYEFWALICEHSHATKNSMQVSIELKSEDEQDNVAENLAMLNALLEFNYHLLNTHLITPELAYMDKFYSTRISPKIRDYDTPKLKERAHIQFKKNRGFLGCESIKLISAYKRNWVVNK